MNFLVTAGPTREYVDPVRFISNPSSGRMGIEVARAARRNGHKVILVTGPCSIEAPRKITLVKVTTALEMLKAVKRFLDEVDVLVMAAAVTDWRPKRISRKKIKKNKILNLELVKNPDILTEVGRIKKSGRRIFLAGFSLDTGKIVKNAKEKLRNKNLDLIVANSPRSFGSSKIDAYIISPDNISRIKLISKKKLAEELIRRIQISIDRNWKPK